jgi:hypothetical protein
MHKALDTMTLGVTLSKEIKDAIIAEAISLGSTTNKNASTIKDITDNMATVVDRYDTDFKYV